MFSLGDTALAISKCIQLIYLMFFTIDFALEGHLLVGKFTFTGGEFRRAGGDFPLQFIS